MSGENATVSRKEASPLKMERKDTSNQSLLTIVHDKNKTIEKLQKQLHFQKLQLKYYLSKTFKHPLMVDLSKTCSSDTIDENLPVTLAINQYCRQSGIKSKIVGLYDRMCNIESKITNLLQIQECFLRKAVADICEVVRKGSEVEVQFHFGKLVSNPECMEMFSNLLNANIGLRKNLDTFRICCDRLLIIEEERNMIVEHVYSLPVEQRTNCNYLIGIQIEKVQLQNNLKDILKDQSALKGRVEQLNVVEEQLRRLQEEYKLAYRTSTEQVTDMMRKVNAEALGLIAKSNQQREKYTREIVKLKSENLKISKLLDKLKSSISQNEHKDSLRLDAVYSAGLYQSLDKEINQAIKENEMSKETTIQKLKNECRELTQTLQVFQNKNHFLEQEIDLVKTEFNEAKRQWEVENAGLKEENENYKAQVEDLEAIRAAYAQLVESKGDILSDTEKLKVDYTEKEKEKKRITELEKENIKLCMESAALKEETRTQKSKIMRLSGIILNLNGNGQKQIDAELETKDAGCGDKQTDNDSKLPKSNSCTKCQEKSKLEKGIIIQELQKSKVSTQDLIKLVREKELDEITTNILEDLSKRSHECSCDSSAEMIDASCWAIDYAHKIIDVQSERLLAVEDMDDCDVPSKPSAKKFTIQTHQADPKTSSMREALQDIRSLRDRVKSNEVPVLSLLRTSTYKSNKTSDDILELTKEEEDEYELLKDCSLETTPRSVSPIKTNLPSQDMPKDFEILGKKYDPKAIRVTYRNTKGLNRFTTDSDSPTNESNSGDLDNSVQVGSNTKTKEICKGGIVYKCKKGGKIKSLTQIC